MTSKTSRRRPESDGGWGEYCVDVQKILSSNAYARYADKTQVVYLLHHDHIATRALHVQLVSFLARTIGCRLGLSLDLLEAISLGHDLGHAPFGHEGEKYLREISVEAGLGPFSHARQSCRVAAEIEPLNLTLATLDGFLCHDGGLTTRLIEINPQKSWQRCTEELEYRLQDPEANIFPATTEAALVKLADTASYLERDIEDGLTLGLVVREQLLKVFPFSEGRPLTQLVAADVVKTYLNEGKIGLSEEVFAVLKVARAFCFDHIYFHAQLKTESEKVHSTYRLLFEALVRNWAVHSKGSILWRHFLHDKSEAYLSAYRPEQYVVDYIAGMTDGYFLRLFEELFVPSTIFVPGVLPFR